MRIDIVLLLLRVTFGLTMALSHGLPKLLAFNELASKFSDPFGLGPKLSLICVIFAEFFCAGAVALGFFTRLAALPVIFAMLVAFMVIHGDDPWAKKEASLLFATVFIAVAVAGAGRFSVDHYLPKFWRQKRF